MSSLTPDPPFDPSRARAQLAGLRGPALWRSLEELSADDAFLRWLHREQPQLAEALNLDRRGFLRFMGASLALAGLSGCGHPPQTQIVPYVQAPVGQIDGLPRFFATQLPRGGYARGVLVESHMGRPTKVEGNPQHPASLGATDIFAQASVLQLWDPDRSPQPLYQGGGVGWDAVATGLEALRARHGADQGQGLRILTGPVTSPTLLAQLDAVHQSFPRSQWHVHRPEGAHNAFAGAAMAFGEPLATRLLLDRAKLILALDADFLTDPAAGVRYARDYIATRAADANPAGMSRLYVIEPTPSLTGAMADHRLALESSRLQTFARRLAQRLEVLDAVEGEPDALESRWLDALTMELKNQGSRALVVVGSMQPPWLHALGHALNAKLGAVGHTVEYTDAVERIAGGPGSTAEAGLSFPGSLPDLVRDMHAGTVDTLLVLDSNPAYDAPADLPFGQAALRVPHLWHLGLYHDETGQLAEWHLPMAHALESWSDARAYDGTASLAQPLIAPLYGGRTAHELLAALLGEDTPQGPARLRKHWQAQLPDDASWNAALQSGIIEGTRLPARAPPPLAALTGVGSATTPSATSTTLELLVRPDPTIGEGQWSNNGWLQELPKPMTQLTWENVALLSPALAAQYQLVNGDMVRLQVLEQSILAPVWVMPGQATRSITVHLGYGRRAAGRIGTGQGFDAYRLRSSEDPDNTGELRLQKTGAHVDLASTQHHFTMDGRDPVRIGTLDEYQHDPHFATRHDTVQGTPPTLYPPQAPGEYAWGMTIDLDACIGCKACTIACQAENNIPVVGKDQVLKGREMHWIRVDRYFEGSAADPRIYSQPVPCMMCEHAPCELVCPVEATVHDSEGLNLQVYNRCVGTRFCSNNCPYKVRRFNFLKYTDDSSELLAAQRNPEVTVRRRGVMEKCTYCIQRIEGAHIEADKQNRRIADGEVLTACQAACPTQAIRFGDSADPTSQVAQAKRSARNYVLLNELNTRPRTSYLARVRNPNPALENGDA